MEKLLLHTRSSEDASSKNSCINPASSEDEQVCEDCCAVPWEYFGASDEPSSLSIREPFISWKYTVPDGHAWPGGSACRICRFLRELLQEYGYDSTASISHLRGGWDTEKPFKMTFVRMNESEDSDNASLIHSENQSQMRLDASGGEDSQEDSEDEVLTIWEDSEVGHQTFAIPSFFATYLEVGEFQSKMQGYKTTDINFEIVKSWLEECDRSHNERCAGQNRQYVRNLKVIDCTKRLIVSAPNGCPFVALSYVWGPPSAQPSLASSDLKLALPRTIEDSIVATRKLGFAYLWIDRYCINQDDEQEKQEQIAQMADIYASAAVTIIAVAGDDPSHGLPGIRSTSRGLHRYETVRSIRLFANPSMKGSDRYPPYYVHESKWATRAWTYQECYNSPRRLFFTTEQITLVCNSAVYQETTGVEPCPRSSPIYTNLRGWVKQSDVVSVPDAVIKAVPYPLASMMDILNVYSHRQMSYDSDAMNAIVGTLNTFARQSISHLWGVPNLPARFEQITIPDELKTSSDVSNELFHARSNDTDSGRRSPSTFRYKSSVMLQGQGSIALLWHHHNPCRRRTGFPSWSPLGWEEGIGWYARQTPPKSGGDFITMLASSFGIKTSQTLEPVASERSTLIDYANVATVSQHLIVEAHTLDLRLILLLDYEEDDPYRNCVAFSLDDDMDLLLAVSWDKHPSAFQPGQALRGLFLADANSYACCSDSPHHIVIIIEQHENHWERVGIALLHTTCIRLESGKPDEVCDILEAHQPLFRRSRSGTIYNWDLSCRDETSVEVLDLSHFGFKSSEPWWLGRDRLETIVLK